MTIEARLVPAEFALGEPTQIEVVLQNTGENSVYRASVDFAWPESVRCSTASRLRVDRLRPGEERREAHIVTALVAGPIVFANVVIEYQDARRRLRREQTKMRLTICESAARAPAPTVLARLSIGEISAPTTSGEYDVFEIPILNEGDGPAQSARLALRGTIEGRLADTRDLLGPGETWPAQFSFRCSGRGRILVDALALWTNPDGGAGRAERRFTLMVSGAADEPRTIIVQGDYVASQSHSDVTIRDSVVQRSEIGKSGRSGESPASPAQVPRRGP